MKLLSLEFSAKAMAPMTWNSHLLGKWWEFHGPSPFQWCFFFRKRWRNKKKRYTRIFEKKTSSKKKPGRIRTRSTNLEKIGKTSYETVPKNSWLAIKRRGGSLRVRTQLLLWAPISCRKPSALANKKSSHVSRGKRYLGFYSEIWCPLSTHFQ